MASEAGAPIGAAAGVAVPWANRVDAFIARQVAPSIVLTPHQTLAMGGVALGLGVWANALFANAGFGLNVPLWLGSAVGAVSVGAMRLGRPLARDRVLLLATAVALSMVVAWRDSPALQSFGMLGAVALVFLGVALPAGTAVRRLSPVSCALALASGVVALTTATARALGHLPWNEVSGLPRGERAYPVARALLIATPLLLVFGGLFVAADAVFADGVSRIFAFDLSVIVPHTMRTLFGTWIALSMLWSAAAIDAPTDLDVTVPERHWLRRLEMGIVLGSLAILFALFVIVQLRYLFGGAQVVQASVVLTYAEYARRGFFELVVASLLLLPVLAGVNWARERSADAKLLFLGLASVLGMLLFVIMLSAWQRLAIYREEFGLTELRFYAVATLPWLIVTLATFYAAVVRNRASEFSAAVIAYAAVTLLVLDVLNPDAFIVRTNAARIAEGKPFDAVYAASLSADAVPVLLSRLSEVPPAERCEVFASLKREAQGTAPDVRGWNLSRAQASRLVTQRLGELECR